jgi:predicted nucleotidyltransferase
MIESFITSKARVSILRLFFQDEKRQLHLREISRLLGLNVSQIRSELERLYSAGFLKKTAAGRTNLYSVDNTFVFYNELRSMIRKSAGVEGLLSKALSGMTGIRSVFIFGSYAEGREGPRSDIDLMIIGEPDMDDLNRRIGRVEKTIRKPVEYVVYPEGEFEKKRKYGFIKNVIGKKRIHIMGDDL